MVIEGERGREGEGERGRRFLIDRRNIQFKCTTAYDGRGGSSHKNDLGASVFCISASLRARVFYTARELLSSHCKKNILFAMQEMLPMIFSCGE